jgi:spermidine/putrescine-binding protein
MPSRREFLAASVGAAVAGCGWGGKEELRVFCYAGGHDKTMREVFVPGFEALTGATVSLYPGWWDGVPKLKAAPANDPPFDLMISDATQGFPAAKEGLFAELDLDNIPNYKRMVPAALDNWIFRDRFGVTYPDSVMTLAYNRKKAGRAPTRWADLVGKELSGKVGLYRSFYMSLYTFACIKADLEGKAGTAHELVKNDLDGVMRFARENRKHVKLWWQNSMDMIEALANGECAAGNMHSPEYITALRERPGLAACVPEKDRAFVQVFWSVPAGSKKKELAEQAIDFIFSDEAQLGFARRGMATATPSVAKQMADEDKFWRQLYPHTAEQFRALRYYPYDVYAKHWDRLADEWDRTVLRKR